MSHHLALCGTHGDSKGNCRGALVAHLVGSNASRTDAKELTGLSDSTDVDGRVEGPFIHSPLVSSQALSDLGARTVSLMMGNHRIILLGFPE